MQDIGEENAPALKLGDYPSIEALAFAALEIPGQYENVLYERKKDGYKPWDDVHGPGAASAVH
jgi:hypothetical protein